MKRFTVPVVVIVLVCGLAGYSIGQDRPKVEPRGGSEATAPPARSQGMVKIPAGEFVMGCNPEDGECMADEAPVHKVWLSEYWMDTTEVTVAAYKKCVEAGKCTTAHFDDGTCFIWNLIGEIGEWKPGQLRSSFRGDNQPVVCVEWSQAKGYCEWAGKRLPSEAEWEKAARGGTTGARYGDIDQVAWYYDNSGGATHPVGQKKPNAFGLYDLLGNVEEWCADWYGKYYYHGSAGHDPGGPESGEDRVQRGGAYSHSAKYGRAPSRSQGRPGERIDCVGFRCAASATTEK